MDMKEIVDEFHRKSFEGRKARKNAKFFAEFLQECLDRGKFKPGDTIHTDVLLSALGDHVNELFNRSPDSKDGGGPIKSIGDAIGNGRGGLRLKKVKNETKMYVFPKKLPKLIGDRIVEEAEY